MQNVAQIQCEKRKQQRSAWKIGNGSRSRPLPVGVSSRSKGNAWSSNVIWINNEPKFILHMCRRPCKRSFSINNRRHLSHHPEALAYFHPLSLTTMQEICPSFISPYGTWRITMSNATSRPPFTLQKVFLETAFE